MRPDVRAFLDMLEAHPRPLFNDALMAQTRKLPTDTLAALDLAKAMSVELFAG